MKQLHSAFLTLTLPVAFAALVACADKSTHSSDTTAVPAQAQSAAATSTRLPGAAVGTGMVLTSTVTAVDLKKRLITLRGEDGQTATYYVNEEVRNLPQVKVGDKLVIEYVEALALKIIPAKAGMRQRKTREYASRAQLGQKPAGQVTRVVEIRAKVQAIDTQNRTVTVRGVEKTLVLKASNTIDLSKIQVGDEVLATYAESFSISVQSPAGG